MSDHKNKNDITTTVEENETELKQKKKTSSSSKHDDVVVGDDKAAAITTVHEQIVRFKNYISDTAEARDAVLSVHHTTDKCSIVMNFNTLNKYDITLSEEILDNPEETLKSFEYAVEEYVTGDFTPKIRLDGLPHCVELSVAEVRKEHLEKIWKFTGLVKQKSEVQGKMNFIRFECPSCNNIITILQLSGLLREPDKCACGRRGRFRIVGRDIDDIQSMMLEESPDEIVGGKQPSQINVILTGDLVSPIMDSKTSPGNKVELSGIVKDIPVLKGNTKTDRVSYFIDANYIKPSKEDEFEHALSKEDERKISDFVKKDNLFADLKRYIGPSIYGFEEAKEAILLQMAGGVKKQLAEGTKRRGDIHILIVGDPSMGKSVLCQSVQPLVYKSRFVSGKGASGVGLTATVTRDEFTGGWALQAGAMVLANGSILIVDELEKMTEEDRSNLHTAMEQGIVSISKATIQATLRTETSILAAANPELGRFSVYEPLAKQLNLSPALISRFDLVFPVQDLPTPEESKKVAKFILDLHTTGKTVLGPTKEEYALFKKYILYVRTRMHPTMSAEAVDEINHFWVTMRTGAGWGGSSSSTGSSGNNGRNGSATYSHYGQRNTAAGDGPIAITNRQLEALVRLSEASAKLRLSKMVEVEDARRAIRLMAFYLSKFGIDPETGQFDVDRIATGIPSSFRTKTQTLRELVRNKSKDYQDGMIPFNVLADLAKRELSIEESDLDEMIEKLKKVGEVYEPRYGFIKTM